jgi:hypothetical protein
MKVFLVSYDGLWMGGQSVVIAEHKLSALQLVKDSPNTTNFVNASAVELPSEGVVYNDNGNY